MEDVAIFCPFSANTSSFFLSLETQVFVFLRCKAFEMVWGLDDLEFGRARA